MARVCLTSVFIGDRCLAFMNLSLEKSTPIGDREHCVYLVEAHPDPWNESKNYMRHCDQTVDSQT